MKTTEEIEKIKKTFEETELFKLSDIKQNSDGSYTLIPRDNIVFVKPLNYEHAQMLKKNPYLPKIQIRNNMFVAIKFPLAVRTDELQQRNESQLSTKFKSKLDNIIEAQKNGNIKRIAYFTLNIKSLPYTKYTPAKPYKAKQVTNADKPDTLLKQIVKSPKEYLEIKSVSLNYNTLVILKNATENKNLSLMHYAEEGATAFYTDCIFAYIMEHSQLLNPDYTKYETTPKEVHMNIKQLKKLFPNKMFTLKIPEGVTITYISKRENVIRNTDNDTVIIKFTDEYLRTFRSIIQRETMDTENIYSFIRVPMFFILQALKKENLSPNGFKFLLWFLAYYRMPSPRIFHTLRKIIEETGMDIKHGYRKPVETLNRYFDYLYKVNVFANADKPFKLSYKDLDMPPKINKQFIQIKKPQRSKDNS